MVQYTLLQEAAEGDFIANPALLGILIIAAVVLAVFWYNTHCPNCKRIFTRELIKKGKVGLLPTAISGKERRRYRCKHCRYDWEKNVYVD